MFSLRNPTRSVMLQRKVRLEVHKKRRVASYLKRQEITWRRGWDSMPTSANPKDNCNFNAFAVNGICRQFETLL